MIHSELLALAEDIATHRDVEQKGVEQQDHDSLTCTTPDDADVYQYSVSPRSYQGKYTLHLPSDFMAKYREDIRRTHSARIVVPSHFVNADTREIRIPTASDVTILQQTNNENDSHSYHHDDDDDKTKSRPPQRQAPLRYLKAHNIRTGRKRLLVVRVMAQNGTETPEETIQEIRETIFGLPGQNSSIYPTVVSQYDAASHGYLKWIPATGTNIQNGIAEITITHSIANANRSIHGELHHAVMDACTAKLGNLREISDHVMFCLPNGSLLQGSSQWTAFTYMNSPFSFFQMSRCTKLSVVMHEIGHSLGFRHSAKGADPYGDEQGYMGYAINEMFKPRKGFNAHKHWISGWYTKERIRLINLDSIQNELITVPLVAFVDAYNPLLPANMPAIIKVHNLYVHFNRAKGYNMGTNLAQKDKVVINYADHDEAVSDLVASLNVHETYQRTDISAASIFITVCKMDRDTHADADYAVVSIYGSNIDSPCPEISRVPYLNKDRTSGWFLDEQPNIVSSKAQHSETGHHPTREEWHDDYGKSFGDTSPRIDSSPQTVTIATDSGTSLVSVEVVTLDTGSPVTVNSRTHPFKDCWIVVVCLAPCCICLILLCLRCYRLYMCLFRINNQAVSNNKECRPALNEVSTDTCLSCESRTSSHTSSYSYDLEEGMAQ